MASPEICHHDLFGSERVRCFAACSGTITNPGQMSGCELSERAELSSTPNRPTSERGVRTTATNSRSVKSSAGFALRLAMLSAVEKRRPTTRSTGLSCIGRGWDEPMRCVSLYRPTGTAGRIRFA